MTTSAASEKLGDPVGDPPHVAVVLRPMCRNGTFLPDGYVGLLGRSSPLSILREQLCSKLEVAHDGMVLVHEGQDMEGAKTLSENGLVLPGPARRRAGFMPEIFFDLKWEEVERQKKVQAAVRAEIAAAEARRLEAEQRERRRREEERQRELERIREEEERRQREEQRRLEQAQAAIAQTLAGLPMELRRIEYSFDWGILVTQRLQEIARLAGISERECMDRVSVISARGGLVMEAFGGGEVPEKDDFPFILVFGPVTVQIIGPTHTNVQRLVQEDERGFPICWNTSAGAGLSVPVEVGSDEFHAVTGYFRGTLGWLPNILSLDRVQNEEVYSHFKGRGEPSLTIMFHGCRSSKNEASILQQGFQTSKCVSGGTNYGIWCAYAASYSDSGFVYLEPSGVRHLFICVVSRTAVKRDNETMRVVGQDCAYPLWLVTYKPTHT
mmetsp:Transcript_22489/g.46647  ORF Transcript_22489/g.46647 Transcript_22489/m.46647 type:complete len:440 (+) Transcript_22489:40-1359(+)